MNHSIPSQQTPTATNQSNSAAPVRRNYSTPTLKLQGSISHLTQGMLRGPRVGSTNY
jgi:hypothetical protein